MQKCKKSVKVLALLLALSLVLSLMPSMPLYAEVAEYESYAYDCQLPPLYEPDELDNNDAYDGKDDYGEPTGDAPTGEEPDYDEKPTDQELGCEEPDCEDEYYDYDDCEYYYDIDYGYEEAYCAYREAHLFVPFFTGPFLVMSPQRFQKVTEVLFIEVAANATELAGEVDSVVAVIEGIPHPLTFDPVSYMATASLNFFELGIANMQVVEVSIVLTTIGGAIHEDTILVPYIFDGAVLSYFHSDPAIAQQQANYFSFDPGDIGWQAGISHIQHARHPINSVYTNFIEFGFEATNPAADWQEIKPILDVSTQDLAGVVSLTFDVYVPYFSADGGSANPAINAQNSNWQMAGKIVFEGNEPGGGWFWTDLEFDFLALNNAAYTSVTGPALVDRGTTAAQTTWRRRSITMDVSALHMAGLQRVTLGLVLRAGNPWGAAASVRPTFDIPLFVSNIQFHAEPDVPRNQIFEYFETYIGHSGWFNHLNPTVNATAELGREYARFGDFGLRLSVDGPGAGSVTLNARSSFNNAHLDWSHATNYTNLFFWVQPHDAGPWLDVDVVSNEVQYSARVNWDDVIANAWHVNSWYRVNIPFANFMSMGGQSLDTAANRDDVSHIRFTIQSGSMYLDHIYAHRNVPDPLNYKTPLDVSSFVYRGGTPVDPNITVEAASLFQFLRNVMYDPNVIMFGHQQTTQDGLSFSGHGDFTRSDVKLGVNDYPAVFGYDSMTFAWDLEEAIDSAIFAAQELGAIITLAKHMGNPMGAGLPYNNMTNAFVGENSVLVETSAAHARLVAHFEMIYEFASALQDAGVPIIFRPWHEVTRVGGSNFFWWHHASPEQYVALWQWSYDFLTRRGIHNMLWAYSPNTDNAANIIALYTSGPDSFFPGDEFVDIFGYDTYTTNFSGPGNSFVSVLDALAIEAKTRDKILALTETGSNTQGNPPPEGYFVNMLNALMAGVGSRYTAYVLTWANYTASNFFIPWPEFDNEPEHPRFECFVRFYNDPRAIFASQTGGFEAITGLRLRPVTDVSIQEDNATINVGETKILTAIFSPIDARNADIAWTSANPDIATVSTAGVVTAVAPGEITITVRTDCGRYDTIQITVIAVPVTGVSIDQTGPIAISLDETYALTATILPANATNRNVTWSSANPDIAAVSATGVVTAIAPGTATITVTTNCGNHADTIQITVTYTLPPCCAYYPYCDCDEEPYVDLTALETLVAEALALNQNAYTANSWANMVIARTAAQEVLTNPEATQDEVDAAFDALYAAINALVPAPGPGVQQPPPEPPLQQPEPPPLPPDTALTLPSIPYIPWAPRIATEQPAIDDASQYEEYDDDMGDVLYEEYEEDDKEYVADAPPLPSLNRLIFTVGNIQYVLNDNARTSVGEPFIDPTTDRMMIPLRTLTEAIGANVEWNSATRSAIIDLPTGQLILPVDEPLPDGMGIPMLVNDRAFIPLRFVMYAFNKTVEWDSANRAAIISW